MIVPSSESSSLDASLAPAMMSIPSVLTGNSTDTLVTKRLGPYSALFFALRAKHPPTASHSLRVALGCSKWALYRSMDPAARESLELAALLHDLGKIGVPDDVIQKPGELDRSESMLMDMSVNITTELVRAAGGSQQLLDVLEHYRYRGRNVDPVGGRLGNMLAIVDAYDSLTNEQAFRRAVSSEKALEVLGRNVDVQFDDELVRDFMEFVSQPRSEIETQVAKCWLADVIPGFLDTRISSAPIPSGALKNLVESQFHPKLINSLPDAVIYVDAAGQIIHWNRAAERVSGQLASSLLHCRWNAKLLGLCDEHGTPVDSEACPITKCAQTHSSVVRKMQIRRTDGKQFAVSLQASPVMGAKDEVVGFMLLIRDSSTQVNLAERVQTLHVIATQDPLTKVFNRAALNQKLSEFVRGHKDGRTSGAVIICDIDFFKRINDKFSHQAGDDALKTFASILQENARSEDFVARFGGEEFVILCSNCDIPTAVKRAEELRKIVERTPVQAIEGRTMTASFGVTELQAGDSEETFFARADRALMNAKSNGRNRVEQLGTGGGSMPVQKPELAGFPESNRCETVGQQSSGWMRWFLGQETYAISGDYLAAVPKEVAVQKIEGFIADHQAEIVHTESNRITLRIDGSRGESLLRLGERGAKLEVDIRIKTVQLEAHGRTKTYQVRTQFSVSVKASKSRDRRSTSIEGQAKRILHSFRAYMVAQEIDDELRKSIIEPRS